MTPESEKSEAASIAKAFEAVSKEIGMKAWPELCSMSRFLLFRDAMHLLPDHVHYNCNSNCTL